MSDLVFEFNEAIQKINVSWNDRFGDPHSSHSSCGVYKSGILYIDEQKRFPFIIGYEVVKGKHPTRCFVEVLPPEIRAASIRIELTATFAVCLTDPSIAGEPSAITAKHDFDFGRARYFAPIKDSAYNRLYSDRFSIFFQILAVRVKKFDRQGKNVHKLELLPWTSAGKMCKTFDEQNFMDFEIEVEDQVLMASKFILASHSDVFATMFDVGMTETKTNSLKITDFSAQTVTDMLKYLHSGCFFFPEEGINELAQIADKYNIITLMERCDLEG